MCRLRTTTVKMADLYEPDFGTVYYRSRDPVKNLKIRVKLSRVTAVSIVPQAVVEKEGSQDLELQDLQRNQAGQTDTDEYTFSWQEKVFSQREIDLYSSETNCENVIEKKYHKQVLEIREVGKPTTRLFSYTNSDPYVHQSQTFQRVTTSANEQPSYLSNYVSEIRHRKPRTYRRKNDNDIVPKVNIVDLKPTPEVIKKNRVMSYPEGQMYIMADLSPKQRDATIDDEYVLAVIKVDCNGVLSIQPDFNNKTKPYVVETTTMSRDNFEYTIQHSSKEIMRQEQDKESKMYKELYSRHTEFLIACVGHEFEMPPPEVLRYFVLGDLISAKDFEYDNLFVHFFVELPKNWRSSPHQPLSGTTPTCATTVVGRDNVANFSYPFTFELFYKNDYINPDNQDEIPHWPQLYFEVISLDRWQRTRTEGYGYLTLPCKPGVYTETINCWRPLGRTLADEMRRFFIGGSPELEDPTYVATPSSFDGSLLSKLGFRTATTGSVTLRMNIMQQAQEFIENKSNEKSIGALLDRLGGASRQSSILGVLDAFHRARTRMRAARENAITDFEEKMNVKVREKETPSSKKGIKSSVKVTIKETSKLDDSVKTAVHRVE